MKDSDHLIAISALRRDYQVPLVLLPLEAITHFEGYQTLQLPDSPKARMVKTTCDQLVKATIEFKHSQSHEALVEIYKHSTTLQHLGYTPQLNRRMNLVRATRGIAPKEGLISKAFEILVKEALNGPQS